MRIWRVLRLAILAWWLQKKIRPRPGNIPLLRAQGRTLAEAWEESVILTWLGGIEVKTEYDRPGDPPSRDCTMVMVVEEPFTEPRIHRGSPGDPGDLEIYRLEVVEGIHDNHVGPKGWSYSYHDRLVAYRQWETVVDQLAFILRKLKEAPYTRRAQAITWNPLEDPSEQYSPCLQRVWCRLLPDQDGGLVLNMNTHWRSRDAYRAAFMNMFAFTDLQRHIAEQLTGRLGERVRIGRYVDVSDSYHIYGKDWEEFKGVLALTTKRSFKERTWTSEFAERFFEKARQKLAKEGGSK